MIREGAMDFFYFGFFTAGGGDTISYGKRGSRFFFCLWVPRRLSNHLIIKIYRIEKKNVNTILIGGIYV